MIRKLATFLLLSAGFVFAQGAQRLGQATQNVNGFVKVLPGAAITACTYPSCGAVTIYSNVGLSVPIVQPLHADKNGNYQYYVAAGNYFENINSPGVIATSTVISLSTGGGGGGGGTTGLLLNAETDCGAKGAPTDDTTALRSCLTNTANYGAAIYFPTTPTVTMSGLSCNYVITGTLSLPKNATGSALKSFVSSYNSPITICVNADTVGVRMNGFNQKMEGITLAQVSGGGWARGVIGTYGVPTANHGVMFCGGEDSVSDSAIYAFSGDDIHISDSDCSGGTTDWATADNWHLKNLQLHNAKGYGVYVRGGDSNVGTGENIWGVQNQLGVILDSANYGNTWTDVGGDSNASDPLGPTSTVSITSATEVNGTTTFLAPGHGLITGDWVQVAGTSAACLSNLWEYVTVTDSNHFTAVTGCGLIATSTGGTVGAAPGAHIWAVNSLLAGGIVVPQVNGTHLINPYQEGTNGKSIISAGTVDGAEGLLGNINGFVFMNNGVSYARAGVVNTVQNQPGVRNTNGWNSVVFQNSNPSSGNYSNIEFFPGICANDPNPGTQACAFGMFSTTPLTGAGFGGYLSWARNSSANSLSLGGFWGYTDTANDPSNNYRAWSLGTTDQYSVETGGVSGGDLYGVVFNGMLNRLSSSPGPGGMFGTLQSGENLTDAQADLDMECHKGMTSSVANTCRWLGTRLETATFAGLTTTPLGVLIYCTDCTTSCGAGSSTGNVCLSLGSGVYNGVGKQPHICQMNIDGGSLGGGVIASADSLVSYCYNAFGSTATITAVRCWSNNSGTTTVNPKITGGSNLLTGALTCSTSWPLGTLSGTPTLTAGQTFDMVATPDGTTTKLHLLMVLQ